MEPFTNTRVLTGRIGTKDRSEGSGGTGKTGQTGVFRRDGRERVPHSPSRLRHTMSPLFGVTFPNFPRPFNPLNPLSKTPGWSNDDYTMS